MKLSFMSFLYPTLDSKALIAKAIEYRYQGIEWRAEAGHSHGVELEASSDSVRAIRQATETAGLESSCLATSVKFASAEKAEREMALERLTRFIDLAVAVGAPRIRFFADPIPNSGRGARESSYAYQAEYVARACERAAPAGVSLCLETHSNFRAFDAGELLFRTGYPSAFRRNWHLEHCLNHGEDVDEAYRHVKGRVDHAHFSLSPHIGRQIELLAAERFAGFFSLEMMPKESEEVVDGIVRGQAEGWWRLYDEFSKGKGAE
jgi:sugar phosphate isomerase/epimerase